MKFAIDKKIRYGYFSAFILLVFSYFLLFSTTDKMLKQTAWANEKRGNIHQLEKLCSDLKDVEAGYNGYILTGNPDYFNRYKVANTNIDTSLKILSRQFKNDLSQTRNLQGLEGLISHQNAIITTGTVLYNANGKSLNDSLKLAASSTKKIMDTVRQKISGMQATEQSMIEQTDPHHAETSAALKIINFTTMIIAILIAVYSLITYTEENKARRKADEKTILYRRQLEQRIEELNKANKELGELKNIEKFAATGRMARTIAHEVRNPLTNIGLANDQLKDAVEPNEENLMLMNMIKRNGDRINLLISDLLNATKFVELNRTQLSINSILEEVLVMAKDSITLSSIKIERNFSDKVCAVLVDDEKIKIAFLNIIVNAVEAVQPETGIIQITTKEIKNLCTVTITDNGIGMNEEALSKLFEPFFTSKEKGNGLGLTNTQNIILNHKGTIQVSSQPGKGTSFIVSLQCV